MSFSYFPVALVCVLSCTSLHATDRFYADIAAASEDGHWTAEAKSPDNRENGTYGKPFQENFVYTLRHDGRVVWTRKQQDGWPKGYHEPSPVKLSVSNSGRMVIRTGSNRLMVPDANGRLLGAVDPKLKRFGGFSPKDELFTKQEREENVTWTTAGEHWTGGSIDFFHSDAEGELYALRTYWGRWVVLDLKTGEAITPSSSRLAAIEAAARDSIRAKLARYLAAPKSKRADGCPDREAMYAVHQAGCLGMRDMVPAMRRLEADDAVTLNTSFPFGPRLVAQMALRRVGETPTAVPGITFMSNDKTGVPAVGLKTAQQRDIARREIKMGMTKGDVLSLMGQPDFVDLFEESWEYDGDDGTTLVLTLKKGADGKSVLTETKSVGARWKPGAARERRVFRFC